MPKQFSVPAFIELRPEASGGERSFASIEDVLRSPKLQKLVCDRRALDRACDSLRARGLLIEIPYIGPPGGR